MNNRKAVPKGGYRFIFVNLYACDVACTGINTGELKKDTILFNVYFLPN